MGLLEPEKALLLEAQFADQPTGAALNLHHASMVDVQLPDYQVVDGRCHLQSLMLPRHPKLQGHGYLPRARLRQTALMVSSSVTHVTEIMEPKGKAHATKGAGHEKRNTRGRTRAKIHPPWRTNLSYDLQDLDKRCLRYHVRAPQVTCGRDGRREKAAIQNLLWSRRDPAGTVSLRSRGEDA